MGSVDLLPFVPQFQPRGHRGSRQGTFLRGGEQVEAAEEEQSSFGGAGERAQGPKSLQGAFPAASRGAGQISRALEVMIPWGGDLPKPQQSWDVTLVTQLMGNL